MALTWRVLLYCIKLPGVFWSEGGQVELKVEEDKREGDYKAKQLNHLPVYSCLVMCHEII